MKREYWFSLMFAFIVLIGVMTYDFHLTHKLIKQTKTEIREVHDTLVKTRVDSIFYEKPIYVKQTVLKRDTVQVLRPYEHDSVQVELPYIQKEYRDSTYEAYVSGYKDVNLDSIRIFKEKQIIEINNTKYVTKYKNKHWHIGPSVGVGYDFTNNRVAPYLGVSVQYSIFSW